ncbi:uncharacterized protein BJ171DRAFT_269875 [Polychytrium aggregatum]|uniref:uncharacterized protein n=1 Tax=Polychytrium aggregatum TaxID=110093 RepID=UPI0022FF1840|nr:uncharacterized protein BJ171DRAFT_269875 [Polychytrium aggregatum]KAI9193434.1 hypothetical protein BJ171DRAFT_269875 [Polychytrium aggregatum]
MSTLSLNSKEIRVLLLDPIPSAAKAAFQDINFKIDECFEEQTEGSLLKMIGDYQIVCVSKERDEVYLTEDVLRSAHRLLAIGMFSRSTQQVDLATAQTMGVSA